MTKDVWLIGDEFLRRIHHNLQEWKSDQSSTNRPLPYICNQYNVSAWYDSPLTNNHTGRIYNSFIDGLNSNPKLPKYELMIIDADIIIGSNHLDYGIMHIIKEQLDWLFSKINKAIHRRQEDLKAKRGGAVSSSFEPRLIWVSMIQCPTGTTLKQRKNWFVLQAQ